MNSLNRYDLIPAIATNYGNINFKSRLEAVWYIYLSMLKGEPKYEPEFFTDGEINYLPDFYSKQLKCYIEIKPEWPTDDEIKKISMLSKKHEVLLCVGNPKDQRCCLFIDGKKGLDVIPLFSTSKYGEYFYTDTFDKNYFDIEYEIAISSNKILYKEIYKGKQN